MNLVRFWVSTAPALAGAALAVHCHMLTGDYEIDAGAGGSTSSSTDTNAGGAAPSLVSQDLLARYFLDDDTPGGTAQQAADSAAAPLLPVNIDYGIEGTGGGAARNLSWVDADGNRGLSWQRSRGPGMLATPILDSKLTASLATSQTLTIELVADLAGDVSGTTLLYLGEASSDHVRLHLESDTTLELHRNTDPSLQGRWQVGLLERHVLHVLIDTTQIDESQRVRLLVDGAELSSTGATPPAANTELRIAAGDFLLGNDSGWNSIQGAVLYAALYSRALTLAQVANNVAILSADDDTPE